jgi:hypothetical protein
MFALSFSDTLRRSHPTNLIMLGVFTLCEAFLVSCGPTRYVPDTHRQTQRAAAGVATRHVALVWTVPEAALTGTRCYVSHASYLRPWQLVLA